MVPLLLELPLGFSLPVEPVHNPLSASRSAWQTIL
jgi:hypothetical protein